MPGKLISQLQHRATLSPSDMIPMETADRANAHATAGDLSNYVERRVETRLSAMHDSIDQRLDQMQQNITDAETSVREGSEASEALQGAVSDLQQAQGLMATKAYVDTSLQGKVDSAAYSSVPQRLAQLETAQASLHVAMASKADTATMEAALADKANAQAVQALLDAKASKEDVSSQLQQASDTLQQVVATKADNNTVRSVASTAYSQATLQRPILDFCEFSNAADMLTKYQKLSIGGTDPYTAEERAQNTVTFCSVVIGTAATAQYGAGFYRFDYDTGSVVPAGEPYCIPPDYSLDPDTGLITVSNLTNPVRPRRDTLYRCLADNHLYFAITTDSSGTPGLRRLLDETDIKS